MLPPWVAVLQIIWRYPSSHELVMDGGAASEELALSAAWRMANWWIRGPLSHSIPPSLDYYFYWFFIGEYVLDADL